MGQDSDASTPADPAWLQAHASALILFARQWVDTHADAEDAVQEGFVRFWPRRLSARDPAAYLYRCVKTAALDQRRRSARRDARERRAASDRAHAEPQFEPGSEAGDAQSAERIEAALAGLPEEQREVLVMKVWGALTYPQIGDALAISPHTAASRYRYALIALRRLLGEK